MKKPDVRQRRTSRPAPQPAPSPNFDERGRGVDTIILHYTGMQTAEEALARLADPESKVSAHYVVDEKGVIYCMVPEEMRAWHAGVASWRGETDINARSVGVEIVNPGHEWGYTNFPDCQIDMVVALIADIRARHAVPVSRVLGHSDVAPGRKEDPGERFPWTRLAKAGQAVGPYTGPPTLDVPYTDALALLGGIGYEIAEAAPGKPAPAAAILAFQRRFCPRALGQAFNPLTKAALVWASAQMAA